METLSLGEVERYLELAGAVAASRPVVDVHVHATEVIFDEIDYSAAGGDGALLSAVDRPFRAPRPAPLAIGAASAAAGFDSAARNRASRMYFTRAYEQTGSRVLLAHMDLARVDVAYLLPVARAGTDVERSMELLRATCSGQSRLLPGTCVAASVPPARIADALDDAVERFGARIVKLHPNLSDIDLTRAGGMERVEAILAACRRAALPLLVHGGLSPILGDCPAASHARLDRLERVDWGASGGCVVLAHCGLFGYHGDADAGPALQSLERILARHDNVVVDTSGLEFALLAEVLRRVDHERILFGSDALYFPMWQAVVRLLRALELGGGPIEEPFARIACVNAAARLGSGDRGGPSGA